MKSLLGKKIGMTSVFTEDGKNVTCTLVEAGPCYVTALKTDEKDGYSAVQLGFQERKEKGMTKPVLSKFKKSKIPALRFLKEIRDFDNIDNLKVELISPIAMEEGLRFAIREGGRTVGAGVVTKILE